MSTGLTTSMAWLIGFCVLAEAAREVCFKQAANHTALFKTMMKPMTWLGVAFWARELVAWTLVPPRLHWTKYRQFHEQIKAQQKAVGVHTISTCHAVGFLAKENRGMVVV